MKSSRRILYELTKGQINRTLDCLYDDIYKFLEKKLNDQEIAELKEIFLRHTR